MCILIGPEGGFSDEEINLAKEKKIKEITLGNKRLRSETAAIYLISALKTLTI
jgi:16S rRNA (uracil1498-N3)-methyltransferase